MDKIFRRDKYVPITRRQRILAPEPSTQPTATTTIVGTLDVASGTHLARGTSTISGEVVAFGRATKQASALSIMGGVLTANLINVSAPLEVLATSTIIGSLEAIPFSYCPITISATSTMPGSLTAIEQPSDDIHVVSSSSGIQGSMSAFGRKPFLENGNWLAYATSTIKCEFGAEFRKVTCITPTATSRFIGLSMSAGFTDPNLFFKTATSTFFGTLGISAIYARSTASAIEGELTALGRNLPIGFAQMESDRANLKMFGRIGAGTIDGRKTAVIDKSFGSLEIYNNSQGGFYTIGSFGDIKEVFALSIIPMNMEVKGSRDTIQYRGGESSIDGDLVARGTTNVTATSTITGTLATSYVEITSATSTIVGAVTADGFHDFEPTFNGELSPIVIANAFADFEHFFFKTANADATAETVITAVNSPSDTILQVVSNALGNSSGTTVENPPTYETVFNLNERADTINMYVAWSYSDSDHANYPTTVGGLNTTIDPASPDENPADGIEWGMRLRSSVEAKDPAGNPPRGIETGQGTAFITFTFKKQGFHELSLQYRITTNAIAFALSEL